MFNLSIVKRNNLDNSQKVICDSSPKYPSDILPPENESPTQRLPVITAIEMENSHNIPTENSIQHISVRNGLKTYRYSDPKELFQRVNEKCPCCISIDDLDDVIYFPIKTTLQLIAYSEGSFNDPGKINPLPSSGLQWFSNITGGYFSLAGMYFSRKNYIESDKRVNILKEVYKNNTSLFDSLKSDPNLTKEEFINLCTFLNTLDYSIREGRFHKWVGGAISFSSSMGIFISLAYFPFSGPAILATSIYSMGYISKYSLDMYRTCSLEHPKLNKEKDGTYLKLGKEVYIKRLTHKYNFYKKLLPNWILYSSGISILGIEDIYAITQRSLPYQLVILGGAMLCVGLISAIYFDKTSKIYTPKNENRINRRFLGNEDEIYSQIAQIQAHIDIIESYTTQLEKNSKEHSSENYNNLLLKKYLFYLASLATLNVPNCLKQWKSELNEKFYELQQLPELKAFTDTATLNFYKNSLTVDIQYYQSLLEQANTLSTSYMKYFLAEDTDVSNLSYENLKCSFMIKIKELIEKRICLTNNIQKINENFTPESFFEITWSFMELMNLTHSVMKKVYITLDITAPELKANFVEQIECVQNCEVPQEMAEDGCLYTFSHSPSEYEHYHLVFNKHMFSDALKNNDAGAKSFLQVIHSKLSESVTSKLLGEYTYTKNALCNHIEELSRFRTKNEEGWNKQNSETIGIAGYNQ